MTVLAVPCAYFANEWRIVAARWNWLLRQHIQFVVYDENKASAPKLPYVRRLLRDHPVRYVFVSTQEEKQIGNDLFPEAEVSVVVGLSQ